MNSWESNFPADVSLLGTCRASIIAGATHPLSENLPDAVSREGINSTPSRLRGHCYLSALNPEGQGKQALNPKTKQMIEHAQAAN